ncbi:MAG: ATP-binding protein [Bacillota bacterium]|nr:MAG: ATP-binding protein [Bacillota bacterium]
MDNLCIYFLDLMQNSIAAKATLIELHMVEDDMLHVVIKDNGQGMSKETLSRASSPFYSSRTTRKVGLGLSMMKMLIDQTEGSFELNSEIGVGTELKLKINLKHIDTPDVGDIGELIYLISIHQDVKDFIFTYQVNGETYIYDLKEIKEILGDELQSFTVMKTLNEMINKEINTIRGTK